MRHLKTYGKLFEDAKSFESWFKNSKVVDDNGEPLVVYHQTQEKFEVFDIMQSYTHSFWFTSSKDKIDKGETGANTRPGVPIITMPVYLSIQNMAGWDEYEKYGVGQLIGLGFDGIKLGDDYVVFEPNQIKSAVKNNGNYDPNNPNITK